MNGEEVILVAPTQIHAVVQQHSDTPALPSAGYEGGDVDSPSASASGGSKGVSYRNGSYSNGAGNGGSGDYAQIS